MLDGCLNNNEKLIMIISRKKCSYQLLRTDQMIEHKNLFFGSESLNRFIKILEIRHEKS